MATAPMGLGQGDKKEGEGDPLPRPYGLGYWLTPLRGCGVGRSSPVAHYQPSYQFTAMCESTRIGTEKCMQLSIRSTIIVRASSASPSGASNTSSS